MMMLETGEQHSAAPECAGATSTSLTAANQEEEWAGLEKRACAGVLATGREAASGLSVNFPTPAQALPLSFNLSSLSLCFGPS